MNADQLSEVEITPSELIGMVKSQPGNKNQQSHRRRGSNPDRDSSYRRVEGMLQARRPTLERIVTRLMEKETLDERELKALLEPSEMPHEMTVAGAVGP